MNKTKKINGFSLVELLVSIGIIATLTAILLPNFMGARERAKDATKIQDMGAMKNALRLYYNDRQAYPTGTGVTLGTGFTGYMSTAANLGYDYNYYQVDTGDGFVLCVNLDSGVGNDDTDSQAKCNTAGLGFGICGLSTGATGNKVYAVCAK